MKRLSFQGDSQMTPFVLNQLKGVVFGELVAARCTA